MNADIVLHHYWESNYSEKARLMLGFKGLDWRSVIIPDVMPKPDLVALTGGYSKTPVMQIGADVYCDTRRIADLLEEKFPQPPFYPQRRDEVSQVIESWAEGAMTVAGARFLMGRAHGKWRPEFHADRAALWGVPVDLERMARSAQRYRQHLLVYLGWISAMLADGRPFLRGSVACLTDLACHHVLWFLAFGGEEATEVLLPFPLVREWLDRVTAIGHGRLTPMTADEALQAAHDATPAARPAVDPGNSLGLRRGERVSVRAEVAGRDAVTGDLVVLDDKHVAVGLATPRVGNVVVHFPRAGYAVERPS